jgi:hypothetical protein
MRREALGGLLLLGAISLAVCCAIKWRVLRAAFDVLNDIADKCGKNVVESDVDPARKSRVFVEIRCT